jgi:hypothetical protein
MSSPVPPPKLAEETEESVDLGEESDEYDAEFDVNALLLVLHVGKSCAYYHILFREKRREKKDITKRKMMTMKRKRRMRNMRRGVYNRYVFF